MATEPRRYWRRYLRDMEYFWLLALDRMGWSPSADIVKEHHSGRTVAFQKKIVSHGVRSAFSA